MKNSHHQFYEEIYSSYSVAQKILSIVAIISLALATYSFFIRNIYLLVIFDVCLLGCILIKNFLVSKVSMELKKYLNDEINLEKYQKSFQYLYSQGPKKSKKIQLEESYLADAIVAYLRGEFKKCLEIFSYQKLDLLPISHRKKLSFNKHYYSSLANLHLENWEAYQMEKQSLALTKYQYTAQSLQELEAIFSLVQSQPTDYFDKKESKTRLGKIIDTYYQAKNALLQGNEDKAKVLFTEIKDENPELFYVREAREYLGEN